MAAYFNGPAIGRSSLSGGIQAENLSLPNGGCSFKDLSAGFQAPSCGCRRFWLNKSHVITQESERAWCFCGHHACFHENVLPAVQNPINQHADGIATHTPNGTQQLAGFGAQGSQIDGFVAPTWSSLIGEHDHAHTELERPPTARPTTGLGIRNTSHVPADSVGHRLWHALNGFARQQENGRHSGNSSKLPSTAVPSVYDEPGQASPSRILRAQSQAIRGMRPPVNIPPINIMETRPEEYSATEVATPSVRGTPDLRATTTLGVQANSLQRQGLTRQPQIMEGEQRQVSTQDIEGSTSMEHIPPITASMGPSLSIQEMCNTIQEYGRRLSVLEGISFSHMPSEEVQQAFDLQDGRLIDLESWRRDREEAQAADETVERLDDVGRRLNELETWRNEQDRSKSSQEPDAAPQTTTRKRQLLSDTSSVASDRSFDEDAAAQTEAVVLATLAATAETGPRIDALESRISLLEDCSMPSIARPWHVSVVVLPWGRQLSGIWFSALESTHHSNHFASNDWSGHHAASKGSFMSAVSSGAWTTESIEAWAKETEDEWLSPKACGPFGTVFQRLASRGLVRDVVLQSPHAHHIIEAISRTFGKVIHPANDESMADADLVGKYQALQERFIPLRKVRRSSRLRFLTPAEMVTSATWTADFLESSVFMKVNDGERRLYVTTADGYMQPESLGWSWPELRSLPAFDVDGIVQEAQVDGAIVEACWTYNDRLDHAASSNASFASTSGDLKWRESEEDEIINQEAMLSPTATSGHRSRGRSASLPSSTVEKGSVAVTKRRVASFDLEPAISMADAPEYFTKRRRISNTSEVERRGVNFTPRWSREPPSPYFTEDFGVLRSSQATDRARGTTPFAYATPHSHFESRGGDGDTEVDDVMTAPVTVSEEEDEAEEWEGVQDEDEDYQERRSKKSGTRTYDQEDDYEHERNLEDGLSIDGM